MKVKMDESAPALTKEYVQEISAHDFVHRLRTVEWQTNSHLPSLLKGLFYTPYKHETLIDHFVELLTPDTARLLAFLNENAVWDLEEQLAAAGRPIAIKKYEENYDLITLYLSIPNFDDAKVVLQQLLVSGCKTQEEWNNLYDAFREVKDKGVPEGLRITYDLFHM